MYASGDVCPHCNAAQMPAWGELGAGYHARARACQTCGFIEERLAESIVVYVVEIVHQSVSLNRTRRVVKK